MGVELTGKVAVVTGASGGLGVFATQLCAVSGAHAIGVISDDAKTDYVLSMGAKAVLNRKTFSGDEGERVMIAWSDPHPEYAGRDFFEVQQELGLDVDEAIDHLSPAGGIYFQMAEEDVRTILQYPETMIGSDGLPNDRHPHPRLWGTFPRVIGHYGRDLGLFSVETAVYKMTGLTARQFRLKDRGFIRVGCKADVTIFDPETIRDVADWASPHAMSIGIERVFVNGTEDWRDGRHTNAAPGQVIRRH